MEPERFGRPTLTASFIPARESRPERLCDMGMATAGLAGTSSAGHKLCRGRTDHVTPGYPVSRHRPARRLHGLRGDRKPLLGGRAHLLLCLPGPRGPELPGERVPHSTRRVVMRGACPVETAAPDGPSFWWPRWRRPAPPASTCQRSSVQEAA